MGNRTTSLNRSDNNEEVATEDAFGNLGELRRCHSAYVVDQTPFNAGTTTRSPANRNFRSNSLLARFRFSFTRSDKKPQPKIRIRRVSSSDNATKEPRMTILRKARSMVVARRESHASSGSGRSVEVGIPPSFSVAGADHRQFSRDSSSPDLMASQEDNSAKFRKKDSLVVPDSGFQRPLARRDSSSPIHAPSVRSFSACNESFKSDSVLLTIPSILRSASDQSDLRNADKLDREGVRFSDIVVAKIIDSVEGQDDTGTQPPTPVQTKRKDSRTNLTSPYYVSSAQIALLRHVWNQMNATKGPTVIGTLIFDRMFFKHQKTKELFSELDFSNKYSNLDQLMKCHAKSMTMMLDALIKNLEDIESQGPMIEEIGAKHADLFPIGFRVPLFDQFAQALLDRTLEWGEKSKRVDDTRKAWAILIAFMLEKLQHGFRQARKRRPRSNTMPQSSESPGDKLRWAKGGVPRKITSTE